MLTPKLFEKWNNQSLKLLPSSFYFNVQVKGTPKKLGVVIQACNLSIWEDEEGGAWVWGLPGLHSGTMSQNNNNYKASKAFMAKDVLGKSAQVQPLETHGDHPASGVWASGLWGLSSPRHRNWQSKHRLVITKSFLFYLACPSSTETHFIIYWYFFSPL